MQPSPIPSELGPSFTAKQARDAGVSASRLRARDLQTPFHGVRVRPPTEEGPQKNDEDDPDVVKEHPIIALARQYALRMTEHEFFSHLSAAIIWGLPLPPAIENTSALDVSVFAPLRASRGRGVHGHQARKGSTTVRRHPKTGLRVSSPVSTWAAVAPMLEHPYDVVAMADAIVRVPRAPGAFARPLSRPLGTIAELDACVRAGRRVGVSTLRDALPFVRLGASSRPETWTRLTLMDAGLPEPTLDHDVFDEYGMFLACVDMAYPELRIAIEYEGDHHRSDAQQWAKDVDRYDALTAHGWRVIRVTKRLLFDHPQELVRRVRTAIDAR
jgi:hypothetical protein